MEKNHTNQTALITGASSGIGLELAKCFAEEGFQLIVVSQQQEELETVSRDLSSTYGVPVTPIVLDLFDPQAAETLYADVKKRGIQVDILVNNAGQGEWGKLYETDLYRQLDIIQLNITSLVSLTYLFLQDMVERNDGKILNVGSVASVMPSPRMAVYAGTKAFVLSFSEAIRQELKDTNINVTTLMPGATDTAWFDTAGARNTVAGQAKKADPAAVAEAGYKALMQGDDKVIEGVMNKLQVGMTNIMPEEWVASLSGKQFEPAGR